MAAWCDLVAQAPAIAEAALRLLEDEGGGAAVAFLATADPRGAPRLAPVCPIFARGALYLCVAERSPKRRDLARDPRFALHAALGKDDEELSLAGTAAEIADPAERAAVHAAIRFTFSAEDPIFRLDPARALHARWENVGRPGTRAVRTRWVAEPGAVPTL